jgi:hypothetical protein
LGAEGCGRQQRDEGETQLHLAPVMRNGVRCG